MTTLYNISYSNMKESYELLEKQEGKEVKNIGTFHTTKEAQDYLNKIK